MHVAVLGAGVAGVTSAWYLANQGCSVTLIDRAEQPGAGASHANGCQLSYSFTDAFAQPSFLPTLPWLLLGRDPAIRIRLATNPSLAGWGLKFLRECTARRARDNTVAALTLALRSASRLAEIRERTGIDFAHRADGKLVLLPEGADLDAARRNVEMKRQHGCATRLLDFEAAAELEPAVGAMRGRYVGAIHAPGDETGDPRAYSRGLVDWLRREHSLDCRFGVTAAALAVDKGRVAGVETSAGLLSVDTVVVCLGAESRDLLAAAGLKVAIYPVRGYSLTLPTGDRSPALSVTDPGRRLLFCPLNGRLRVSGFADFLGFSPRDDSRRLATLKNAAREIAPDAANYDAAEPEPWAGNRPLTPDGRPLVGPTRIPGLYLNCGHGALGWTLAAATGHDVARAVAETAGRRPRGRGAA